MRPGFLDGIQFRLMHPGRCSAPRRVVVDSGSHTGQVGPARAMNQRPETRSPSLLPLRDRLMIWGCLGALTLLSWIYLVRMPTMSGAGMEAMGMAMPMPHQWTPGDMWLTFV